MQMASMLDREQSVKNMTVMVVLEESAEDEQNERSSVLRTFVQPAIGRLWYDSREGSKVDASSRYV